VIDLCNTPFEKKSGGASLSVSPIYIEIRYNELDSSAQKLRVIKFVNDSSGMCKMIYMRRFLPVSDITNGDKSGQAYITGKFKKWRDSSYKEQSSADFKETKHYLKKIKVRGCDCMDVELLSFDVSGSYAVCLGDSLIATFDNYLDDFLVVPHLVEAAEAAAYSEPEGADASGFKVSMDSGLFKSFGLKEKLARTLDAASATAQKHAIPLARPERAAAAYTLKNAGVSSAPVALAHDIFFVHLPDSFADGHYDILRDNKALIHFHYVNKAITSIQYI
jgi:hypothetical protein